MKKIMILLLLLMNIPDANSQVKGIVYGLENNKTSPLTGANVYWLETTTGTTTDYDGRFSLKNSNADANKLVVSFIGFVTDTIELENTQNNLSIVLRTGEQLNEVIVKERLGGSYLSKINSINTEVITNTGLQKLACCNLSESFENNATVDVGFSDAITGAKQIKMLGLAGVYSQLMIENIPAIRGLSAPFGLSFIPGTWMESIQISKGTSLYSPKSIERPKI